MELSHGGSLESPVEVGIEHTTMQVAISSHSGVLVPEPLGGHLANVVRSHVADSGGDLTSRDHTVDIGHLTSVFVGHLDRTVALK